MAERATVSVILPIYNEHDHLASCFDSILANDYPRERLEVLAVDGGSTDGTRGIIEEYARRHPGLRLVENPDRIIPAALNAGLRAATGEILVRMDAHALYEPDYIRTCVRLLEETPAVAVGGLQRHRGESYMGSAISAAMRTPFAAGDAAYRLATEPCWTDTVYLGAWRAETVRELGGWNEDWLVNEDYEFNIRLRDRHRERTGSENAILLSPEIRSWYFGRDSVPAVIRQYFRYGYWKASTARRHPDRTRWRQLVPPLLVLALLATLVLAAWTPLPLIVLVALYGAGLLIATVLTARRAGRRYAPVLPLVFAAVHLSWGTGFLAGVLRFGLPSPFRLAQAGIASLRTGETKS